MISEFWLTGAAIVVLVFLSIIKTAYEALSEVSLRILVNERQASRRARFFRELLENRQQFELILVLGTQLSIACITILLTDIITRSQVRAPLLLAFVTIFAVILTFRQFIPRLIVQNRPAEVLLFLLPVFQVFYRGFTVFVAPINAVLQRLKITEDEADEDETAEDDDEAMQEVQALIDVAEEEGIIEESEGEMIQSVLEFGETLVSAIMRPRPLIAAIPLTATVEDARRLIMEVKYSRLPVYRDNIDQIEGLVYVRDLLAYCEPDKEQTPVSECMRPVHSVPESKPIAELLHEMQRAKVQMAIVIDEYGGVAGLVTVEDIIEEVMGEIEDEDRGHIDVEIKASEDGSYELEGSTEIKVVEALFDKEVEADDFTTIAGLMINEMNRVPAEGEKLEFKGLEFEVLDGDAQRVNKVRLRALEPTTANESEAASS
ncbi:MAG: HlyC/CorC family transporter [Acidobacteria bacterium]|nr:HlyC/CorC family transporter [Acidobacteriota bacterium]